MIFSPLCEVFKCEDPMSRKKEEDESRTLVIGYLQSHVLSLVFSLIEYFLTLFIHVVFNPLCGEHKWINLWVYMESISNNIGLNHFVIRPVSWAEPHYVFEKGPKRHKFKLEPCFIHRPQVKSQLGLDFQLKTSDHLKLTNRRSDQKSQSLSSTPRNVHCNFSLRARVS